MRISYRWLERHVDLDGIAPEQLAEDLTLSTAEVEDVQRFAPWLDELRVGRVVERADHPSADKLSLCTVDVGRGEALSIVCGAPNVAAGQKVAVATVGTVLPGELKIKKARIRGVDSQGMICSLHELELGDDDGGIWVLPPDAPVGEHVSRAMGLVDWVLEIDNKSITHRPDLWGHRGIASEVAAIYERPLKPLDLELPPTGTREPWPLRVESAGCPRYVGLCIDGAQALPSPEWLRGLLLAVGQRPFDQIVDLSNFVMFDLGQPNHVFDRSRLSPEGIVVRSAREAETMVTLDGELRRLVSTDLLICSGDEPVALAGIMGGEGSKVGTDTRSLLLEVANFKPAVVRRTSARLGLRSEASARFEKSLDPTLPARAAAHFARLLRELQPEVQLPAPPADAGEWEDPAHELRLRPDEVRSALGEAIDDDTVRSLLERLGFGVRPGAGALHVAVPSARATKDITIERDLVEEVGRLYRYGNLPERTLVAEVRAPAVDPRRRLVRRVQDRLAGGARFHETIGYSFLDERLVEQLGLGGEPHVTLESPGVAGQSRVRRSVLPTLLASLERNRRQREDVRLFEIGKGYRPEASGPDGLPREVHEAGLVWAGPPPDEGAAFDAGRLHRLQGVLADLLRHVGVFEPRWAPATHAPPWAHPRKVLEAHADAAAAPLATLAELEPALAAELGLSGELASEVALAVVSLDALLEAPRGVTPYRPPARYPELEVDVAVALPEDVLSGRVVDALREAGKGLVRDVELFDIYRGTSLGAGRKSLAYHVRLASDARTLSDRDSQKFLARLETRLAELGGELRRA